VQRLLVAVMSFMSVVFSGIHQWTHAKHHRLRRGMFKGQTHWNLLAHRQFHLWCNQHQVQAAAALLGQLGQPVDGLTGLHQLGGMSAVILWIAERLNRIIDDIDAASTLPRASGEGKIDAR